MSQPENFFAIVDAYKSLPETANLFAVVLYTDEHANIKKVLRDEDYWRSLDELTGFRLCVFSAKPRKGKLTHPSLPSGVVGMMIPVWDEPNENRRLVEILELKDTSGLPMVMLFTKIEEEYLKIELPLKDDTENDALTSLRDKLTFARDVLDRVLEENLKNPEGLFAAAALKDSHRKDWHRLAKGARLVRIVFDLFREG